MVELKDGKIVTNFYPTADGKGYFCKDVDECNANIEAEETGVDFSLNEDGDIKKVKITNGNDAIEIGEDDGFGL